MYFQQVTCPNYSRKVSLVGQYIRNHLHYLPGTRRPAASRSHPCFSLYHACCLDSYTLHMRRFHTAVYSSTIYWMRCHSCVKRYRGYYYVHIILNVIKNTFCLFTSLIFFIIFFYFIHRFLLLNFFLSLSIPDTSYIN